MRRFCLFYYGFLNYLRSEHLFGLIAVICRKEKSIISSVSYADIMAGCKLVSGELVFGRINMQGYVIGIAGAAIISALATIITPKGRLNRLINKLISLFCTIIVLAPVVGFISSESVDDFFNVRASNMDMFDEYYYSARSEFLEVELIEGLSDYGVRRVNVELASEDGVTKIKKISIFVSASELLTEDKHIFISEKAREAVSALYCEDDYLLSVGYDE